MALSSFDQLEIAANFWLMHHSRYSTCTRISLSYFTVRESVLEQEAIKWSAKGIRILWWERCVLLSPLTFYIINSRPKKGTNPENVVEVILRLMDLHTRFNPDHVLLWKWRKCLHYLPSLHWREEVLWWCERVGKTATGSTASSQLAIQNKQVWESPRLFTFLLHQHYICWTCNKLVVAESVVSNAGDVSVRWSCFSWVWPSIYTLGMRGLG